MSPIDYNSREALEGRFTREHIARLVRLFQQNAGLEPDGKFGPKTRGALERLMGPRLQWPLPQLADGRRPWVTSAFRSKDRPNHDGVDMFYRWKPGDKPDFVGDKGCAGRLLNGDPKWVVPYGVYAVAAADGTVQIVGDSPTGYRVWIDHGNGYRTGYFHLESLLVRKSQVVAAGDALGLVGDNPRDGDARHLHFELSPVDRYAPMDPAPYLPV